MSAYVGGLKSLSVDFAAVDEVVTTDGQKLQFLHSGQLTLQRPDRFHAVRRGATGTSEMFLDGSRLTLFGEAAKAYLQLPVSSIDAGN